MRIRYSKLRSRQTGELMKFFVVGVTARTAAELAGVNRDTATAFFARLRAAIADRRDREQREAFDREVETDESYFGGRRKGKQGRGAAGKVAVFGLLKRGGKVYTRMIADAEREALPPIIKRRVRPDSVVYSDTWASYDTLSIEGCHHRRINHQQSLAEAGGRHVNGIENFWNQAKRHLRKFNGVPRSRYGCS